MAAGAALDNPFSRFDCATTSQAKAIILTPEGDLTTDQRWEKETAWLLPRLVVQTGPILDFGCGIGRLAKHLVGPACPVLGIDISMSMRDQAVGYVKSDHFRTGSPEDLDRYIVDGYRATTTLAVWILQHVVDPEREIGRLAAAMEPGGRLYLVNRCHRAVPGPGGGWIDDGVSLGPLLWKAGFQMDKAEAVPTQLCMPGAMFSRWGRK